MKSLFDTAWLLALVALVSCGMDARVSASDGAAEAADSNDTDVSGGAPNDASKVDAGSEGGAGDRDAARDAVADRTVGDAVLPGDASGGADAQGGADAADAAQGVCQHASDCRVVSFECTGCDCLALGTADPDPVCPGNPFQCFQDPCNGHSAACDNGHCAVH